ncbi:MAG: acetate--CoA ligase family protein [Deltaproteobacteria bacterium]|nr:acetate--CoA ligase family protein [Deltaproteobacteria bacterium]
MEFFFNPKGIALIGATTKPARGGFSILTNLLKGFAGKIYPVNPRYSSIEGMLCYPSILDVPDPVDLAIVFVPGPLVPNVIQECAMRKIPGVMIESGGFSETGDDGKKLQDMLRRISQETGIRLWGPNCMGLVDAVTRHVFSFVSPTIWDYGLIPGDVSLIVQSGMLSAGFLIDTMTHGTMGISKVCSVGNKVDVEECELIEYLIRDPHTKAIGLYMESIPDGRRFMEICSRSPKPIVALKGGKSRKGAEAAMSHTASLSGNGAVISGAMSQAGIIEATDFKQMMDFCRTLATFPSVPHNLPGRVAVLTYSGGAGIVSADFIENLGLEVADLSFQTRQTLKSVFPEWMPIANPVDLWPAVEKNGGEKAFRTAVEAVCADPGVDAIFLHLFAGGFSLNFDLSPLADLVRLSGKPMVAWLIGERKQARELQIAVQKQGIPVFREIQRSIECLCALLKRTQRETPWNASVESFRHATASVKWKQVLAMSSSTLDEHVSKQILADFGIPTVPEKTVGSVSEAKAAASGFGFPVVMKGIAPGIVHKSEQGLVRVGIHSNEMVENAFSELRAAMPNGGSILVQQQINGSIELIAGFIRDPQFGPCVMLGLGGILAEALKDTAFAVAPISRKDAFHLMDQIRAQNILNGFRGSIPVNRDALSDILIYLGEIGFACPQIQEIDINPLIVCNGDPVAVDASIQLMTKEK